MKQLSFLRSIAGWKVCLAKFGNVMRSFFPAKPVARGFVIYLENYFGLNDLQIHALDPRLPLASNYQNIFIYRTCALDFDSIEAFCMKI